MGLGPLCLAVVLAQARVPIKRGGLPVGEGVWKGVIEWGEGEFPGQGHELVL